MDAPLQPLPALPNAWRYALYLLPPEPWYTLGTRWLGRCALHGEPIDTDARQPLAREAQIDLTTLDRWTADPRHYGLHATFKPPFRLAETRTVDDLDTALRRFALRIENDERQTRAPEVRVELVDLPEHALVLERIGHRLGPPRHQLGPSHLRDVEGEVRHHRKHDPRIDAAMPSLSVQRRQILTVGVITVAVEKQVNAEVVVAVDQHG